MLCDVCEEKEATVHLTQVVNDTVKKINLCEKCAAESGLDVNNPLDFTDVLLGLGSQNESDPEVNNKTCPACRMCFSDFRKTSRLGCQTCYIAFSEELKPLIEAMHKGKQHEGKVPVKGSDKMGTATSLLTMRKALADAIASENYEEAARIRDEIQQHTESKNVKREA